MAAVRTLAPALPDFTSRDWQSSRNKSQLVTSIMEGKGTAMPPWRAQVTQEHSPGLGRLRADLRSSGVDGDDDREQ